MIVRSMINDCKKTKTANKHTNVNSPTSSIQRSDKKTLVNYLKKGTSFLVMNAPKLLSHISRF